MPQTTQRLVNNFPLESKARRDPSSMAHRLYSVFADYFDYAWAELVKLDEHKDILKKGLGPQGVWRVVLDDTDQMSWVHSAGGGRIYTYPAAVTGDGAPCTRVETLEELLYPVPASYTVGASVSVANWTIWSSAAPGVYNAVAYPERLGVQVVGSNTYFKRSRLTDVRFSGRHEVILTGRDENYIEFEERVQIRDDGFYLTRNIFKTLESVDYEGFDGVVTITLGQVATSHVLDPFRVEVHQELEGPLKLEMSNTSYLATDYGTITYFTDIIKKGEDYRRGDPIDNTETGWEQHLLDSLGIPYTLVDIAISWDDCRLYAIDDSSYLHVYELGRQPFTPPGLESDITDDSYVVVQPIKPHALVGETMLMNTWFQHLRYGIVGVVVKRVDPSANTDYLQADGTWAAGSYQFPGQGVAESLPEQTWTDMQFESTFDEVGEFEFYCIAETTGGTSVACTGVMVDALVASVSIDLSATVAVPTGLYFSHTGELVVASAADAYRFTAYNDLYLADVFNQHLILREEYAAVVLASTYAPEGVAIPNGLDELGFELGIFRLESEDLSTYRRRLLNEIRDPSGAEEHSFVSHVGPKVGEFDVPVFEITLTTAGGVPLAADPFIEITSTRMRLYDDYSTGVPEIEIDLLTPLDSNSDYYLDGLYTTVNASAYFDIEILDTDYTYKRSENLRFENTARHQDGYVLVKSRENQLPNGVIDTVYASAFDVFETAVGSVGAVSARGEYYIDEYNGVIYTYEPARGLISYSYQQFPFTVWWQPVRSYPYNDSDGVYRYNDSQIGDDDGLEEYTVLNSDGAAVANRLLGLHPLGWGK